MVSFMCTVKNSYLNKKIETPSKHLYSGWVLYSKKYMCKEFVYALQLEQECKERMTSKDVLLEWLNGTITFTAILNS
jgi:hypothetical protein